LEDKLTPPEEARVSAALSFGLDKSPSDMRRTSPPILKYFEFAHLPAKLQEVSEPICALAQAMEVILPDGPEKSAGLRKLLEAKDCFVRARL
jgi:hypothetical protein